MSKIYFKLFFNFLGDQKIEMKSIKFNAFFSWSLLVWIFEKYCVYEVASQQRLTLKKKRKCFVSKEIVI